MSYLIRFKQDVADLKCKKVDFHVYAKSEHPPIQGWVKGVGMLEFTESRQQGLYEAWILHIQRNLIVSDNPHRQGEVTEERSLIPLTQRDVDELRVLEDGSLRIWSSNAPETS